MSDETIWEVYPAKRPLDRSKPYSGECTECGIVFGPSASAEYVLDAVEEHEAVYHEGASVKWEFIQ